MAKVVSVGKSPRIKIDAIDGDLSVVGWEGEDVLIKTDEDELTLKQNGEEVLLSSTDDVSLRIPKDSTLWIQRVGGDAGVPGVVVGEREKKNIFNSFFFWGGVFFFYLKQTPPKKRKIF